MEFQEAARLSHCAQSPVHLSICVKIFSHCAALSLENAGRSSLWGSGLQGFPLEKFLWPFTHADFVSFSKVPWTHQDRSYLTALTLPPSAWRVSSPKVTMACTLLSSRLDAWATFPVLSSLATLLKPETPSPSPTFPTSHYLSPYIYLTYLIWHILPYLSCVCQFLPLAWAPHG